MVSSAATTTLIAKIPRIPGTMSFRFARPGSFQYSAGQWFVLSLPITVGTDDTASEGAGHLLEKHFTLSSSPSEPFLEFTTRLTGSTFKRAVSSLELGTEVSMEGPYGSFVLHPATERVAFLAAGIGVTTVRSITRFAADTGDHRPMVLVYGNTNEETITFGKELEEIAHAMPSLRLVHILSHPSADWKGRRGYLDAQVIREAVGDLGTWTFYVSGPPPMVDAVRGALDGLGVGRSRMVFERYEGYTAVIS